MGDVRGENNAYRLEVTEYRVGATPAPSGSTAAQAQQPTLGQGGSNFQDIRLDRNFLPDPAVLEGTAGGSVDASALGTTSHGPCAGRISANPDHRVTLGADFSYLRIRATASGDTSLVVRGPNGALYCNDDAVGLDPQIESAFSAGVYEIYVGQVSGDNSSYRLEITEFRP